MELDNHGGHKMPAPFDIAIYLIKAELKNRKFTKALEDVGFDTTFYSLDFSALILDLLGFETRSDDTFETYHQLLENYVQKIDLKDQDENLSRIASEFYRALEKERY
jgi:hypothetical protein